MEVLFEPNATPTYDTEGDELMLMTRTACRELVTEAMLISFSGGFLAWYIWAKIASYPWIS